MSLIANASDFQSRLYRPQPWNGMKYWENDPFTLPMALVPLGPTVQPTLAQVASPVAGTSTVAPDPVESDGNWTALYGRV